MKPQKKKTYRIATLGCRTNQYESQAYGDQLGALGYRRAEGEEAADLCIINTCTVTESADASSRHQIRQLARKNPGAKVVVTGCMVESDPDFVNDIDGITVVVPNLDKENLLNAVFPHEENLPEFSIQRFDAHTRAFVKVQDGCNSFCTYCVIPYVRGRSRSRTIPEVVEEIRDLVSHGYREIVLTGINIGDFDGGKPKGETPDTLADLIRVVDNIPGIDRIRVSSIDPDEVDDNLMDAILNSKKTCPSMHIVLQAGSNVVLKRMNRKYTRQMFLEAVDRLRGACPEFTFTTDVIVGFPGETEEDFQETLEVMREVRFAKVHMFPYSARPRTRAAQYPNPVPDEVKKRRKREVMKVAEETAFALREEYVGQRVSVLTESSEKGKTSGHTVHFLSVDIEGVDLPPNELVEVELIKNTPAGLIGRLITSPKEPNE